MTVKIDALLSQLSAPARRAIQSLEITTLEDLTHFSEKEVLAWHGIGINALSEVIKILKTEGLSLRSD